MRTAVAILALVAFAAVAVSAQSSTGSPFGLPGNPCERITQGYAGSAANFKDPATQYAAIQSGFIVTVATGSTRPGYPVTAKGLFFDPSTAPYFNGAINYRKFGPTPSPFGASNSPNFLTDLQSQSSLVQHLAQFFGPSLGCQTGTTAFPTYGATVAGFGTFNQYQVHANMNITQSLFNVFTLNAAYAATTYGANADDLTAVNNVLMSFGRNTVNGQPGANEICTQSGCTCAPGIVNYPSCDQVASASAAQLSFVSMIAAVVLALFAMRR